MVRRQDGLRVITLNTDLCTSSSSHCGFLSRTLTCVCTVGYRANYFNYINMTTHDPSGMLRFLTDELQEAEEAGERVWIMGHVLSGWDGTNALGNPTDLCEHL